MKTNNQITTRLGSAVLIIACLLAPSAYADALNRQVRIHNNSSFVMTELRASNIRDSSWREDLLGLGTLSPGSNIYTNLDDGSGYCLYDLKAVFNSGAEVVRRNVNVCAVTDWRIFDHTNLIG